MTKRERRLQRTHIERCEQTERDYERAKREGTLASTHEFGPVWAAHHNCDYVPEIDPQSPEYAPSAMAQFETGKWITRAVVVGIILLHLIVSR